MIEKWYSSLPNNWERKNETESSEKSDDKSDEDGEDSMIGNQLAADIESFQGLNEATLAVANLKDTLKRKSHEDQSEVERSAKKLKKQEKKRKKAEEKRRRRSESVVIAKKTKKDLVKKGGTPTPLSFIQNKSPFKFDDSQDSNKSESSSKKTLNQSRPTPEELLATITHFSQPKVLAQAKELAAKESNQKQNTKANIVKVAEKSSSPEERGRSRKLKVLNSAATTTTPTKREHAVNIKRRSSSSSSIDEPLIKTCKRAATPKNSVKEKTESTNDSSSSRSTTSPTAPNSRDRMEEWELATGAVTVSPPKSNKEGSVLAQEIAFSSVRLATPKGIVAGSIKVKMHCLSAGSRHLWEATEHQERMCSISAGKLTIKMASKTFSIGKNSVWYIPAGQQCLAQNMFYDEATIHVFTVDTE